MAKHKIGWCSMTFNPCWGCRNNCPYCYARAICKRFWKQMYELEFKRHYERHPMWARTGGYLSGLKDFKPTFLYSQYCKKLPKRPQRIFVGSMSEIYYWNEEWIEIVIEKVKQYPQHTFMFLTKHSEVYDGWVWPKNCWLGTTITSFGDQMDNITSKIKEPIIIKKHINYVSIEPILNYVNLYYLNRYNWVIIGAETGNRKSRVIPNKRSIDNIVDYCRKNNIPIYLKDSLKNIYPVEIKEFPKGVKR